ncbi:MAG: KH domain-containing protein [bacterium]|nr:KH domain-containing protein [bacterium]
MKQLTQYILEKITRHPDDVSIQEEKEDQKINLSVSLNEEDVPKVIGKEGKVIRSIRNIVKTSARKKDLWVNLTIDA